MYCFHLDAILPDAGKGNHPDPKVVEVCKAVRDAGMYVGVAIKPGTPVETLYPYIDDKLVDQVAVPLLETMGCCWHTKHRASSIVARTSSQSVKLTGMFVTSGAGHDCGAWLRWSEIQARDYAQSQGPERKIPRPAD